MSPSRARTRKASLARHHCDSASQRDRARPAIPAASVSRSSISIEPFYQIGGEAGTYLRETILIICYLLGLAALFRAAWESLDTENEPIDNPKCEGNGDGDSGPKVSAFEKLFARVSIAYGVIGFIWFVTILLGV